MQTKPHPSKKPTRSIFATLLFSLMAVLLVETAMLSFSIFFSRVPQRLHSNAEEMLFKQVETRSGYLQHFLLQAQDLSALSEQLNEETQRLLDSGELRLDELDRDSTSSGPLLQKAADLLVRDLRSKSVTGIFVVLNTHNLDERTEETRLPGVYLRDLDPDAPSSVRNQDLSFEFAPVDVVRSMEIYTDDCWEPSLRYSRETCAFVYEPFQAAWSADERSDASEYGRWTTEPFILPGGTRQIITYSQPLILSDGTVYGVVGVELLTSYLSEKLPYEELLEDEAGTYLLTCLGLSTMGDALTMHNTVCSSSTLNPAPRSVQLTYQANELCGQILYNGTDYVACAMALSLYSYNAPFSGEQWMLVGMVPRELLFSFSHSVQALLFVTVLLTLATGTVCTIVVSRRLSSPIARLSQEVAQAQANSSTIPHLSPTGIQELDRFSSAFTQLSQDILDTSTKFLRIMHMASIELGGYEIRPDSDIVYVTDNFFSMLGLPEEPSASLTKARLEAILRELTLRAGDTPQTQEDHVLPISLPDESTRFVLLRVAEENGVQVGLLEDVTASVSERHRIEHERDYDILTGLYNRVAFDSHSNALFRNPARLKHAALVMMDLDNLKKVNDTFGHDWGDVYICLAGQYLTENTPPNAICARQSGDEFLVILYGFDDHEAIYQAFDRLRNAIGRYQVSLPNGEVMPLGLSGGVAWYPEDSTELPVLRKYADFAMYQVKRAHKGAVSEFDLFAYEEAAREDQLRREFLQMISEDLAFYHFQPIFEAHTGRVIAYEALMRINLPLLQRPDMVMKLAREMNRLYDVERITSFQAAESFQRAEEAGTLEPGCRLFLNSISSVHLTEEDFLLFRERFDGIIRRIVVEITEEEELDHEILAWKREQLDGLATFALDDYGSGYSNSVNLLEVAPTYIKVDLSIIRGIHTSPDKQEVVRGIVEYAHLRDMQVVAEGIETPEELRCVIALGVDLLQGYFLSRPAAEPEALSSDARAIIEALHPGL